MLFIAIDVSWGLCTNPYEYYFFPEFRFQPSISNGWWCNNHLEKYEFVNGKDYFPYMKWTIKVMFETTNQYI
jgi:hypothetical protein